MDDGSHPPSPLSIGGVVPAYNVFPTSSRGVVPADIGFLPPASGEVSVAPSAQLPTEPPTVSSLVKKHRVVTIRPLVSAPGTQETNMSVFFGR